MLRTAHTTEADLARALARELRERGAAFPAVFPYNRFDHERSTWWLATKGSPAFASAKVSVTRDHEGQLEVGLVVEKGYETPDSKLVPAAQRMGPDWDWHALTPEMREQGFAQVLAALAPHGLRVRVHASPMGARRASDMLVYWPKPWSRQAYLSDSPASKPLATVADAASMAALIDALESNPQRAFCWYDLYISAPLGRARASDDPVVLDERLIDELLLPLVRWAFPGLAPSES